MWELTKDELERAVTLNCELWTCFCLGVTDRLKINEFLNIITIFWLTVYQPKSTCSKYSIFHSIELSFDEVLSQFQSGTSFFLLLLLISQPLLITSNSILWVTVPDPMIGGSNTPLWHLQINNEMNKKKTFWTLWIIGFTVLKFSQPLRFLWLERSKGKFGPLVMGISACDASQVGIILD